MPTSKTDESVGLTALKKLGNADKLGSAGAVTGIILVAFGIFQQEMGVGFGATIRALGGALLLGGLGAVLFGESRRRAAVIGAVRRIVARYMAATAAWRWPNRVGLAGVAVGLILLAPALALQIIFGSVFGTIVIAPGIVLFWVGAALLVYGRFYRRGETQRPPQSSYGSGSRREGRRDDRR